MENTLYIKNLMVQYENIENRKLQNVVLDKINFSITPNKITAIVGESGSGKTTFAKIISGLCPHNAKIVSGEASYQGKNILFNQTKRKLFNLKTVLILQDPFAALNPTLKIKTQFKYCLRGFDKNTFVEAENLLREVGLEHPEVILEKYPSELSGGINQRICIALSLASSPDIIIFDEPTSAIDADNTKKVMELIKKLTKRHGIATIIISHNLSAIKDAADKITVMRNGKIIESTEKTHDDIWDFKEEYSIALDKANNIISTYNSQKTQDVMLKFETVSKSFFGYNVLSDLSFEIYKGETIGIVGASGSGKSTIAKLLVGIYKPDEGNIVVDDNTRIEMVFQNAFGSLNPKQNVRKILNEIARINKQPALHDSELWEYIKYFPLPKDILDRCVGQLSGGQRQMVAILRALLGTPNLIIFDEPTSALDVITQKKLMNLICDLKRAFSLTYIFISHDTELVNKISNRIIML